MLKNKEQGHNNSVKIRVIFFPCNQSKIWQSFLCIFWYQVIDSSSIIPNYQISYSSYHPGLPPLITLQFLNNQIHTCLNKSISHIYIDAIQ